MVENEAKLWVWWWGGGNNSYGLERSVDYGGYGVKGWDKRDFRLRVEKMETEIKSGILIYERVRYWEQWEVWDGIEDKGFACGTMEDWFPFQF